MKNGYLKKWVAIIKKAKTSKELSQIVDKIYQDGFEDAKEVD